MDNRVVVYTTEPCGYCRTAKSLLAQRGVPYDEVNLAKDPTGRMELAERTGMLTFPQIVIGVKSIGGCQGLVRADRSGLLRALAAAA
jgi:glutaredoxin 3